ncbi:MAG: class I SAM-dependent methyltransferase [Armatimonadota bacterium]
MASGNVFTFLKEAVRDFHTTGAVAPSSPMLSRAVAGNLPQRPSNELRILEVGPGTGPVTAEIVKRLDGGGRLELWEISPSFCDVLRKKATEDPDYRKLGDRLSVHEGDVRDLPKQPTYDYIVAGLPYSNFEPEEVQGFLNHFRDISKSGGILLWYEYVAVRNLQMPFVSPARRARLRRIEEITNGFARQHQFRLQYVPLNIPPARIRHLRF